jgi:hypothetical protein
MNVPILLPNIFDHPFTYESGKIKLKLGDYVIIPFGSTKSGIYLLLISYGIRIGSYSKEQSIAIKLFAIDCSK